MKITITSEQQFIDQFRKMGRGEQFSYNGMIALFEYIEEFERDTGEEVELDVIALCVEFTEYTDIEEVKRNYTDIKDIDDLRDNTQVIEFDGGIIIQDF